MYTTPRTNAATNEQIHGEMTYDAVSESDKNEDDIFCTCPQTHTFGSRFSALQRRTPKKKKKKRNTQFRGRFFSNFLARRLAYSLGKQLSARQDHSIDKHLAHIERIGKI